MKFRTLATVLISAYAVLMTGALVSQTSGASATARRETITVGTPVTSARVKALLVRYVNGKDARRSDLPVVNYVLDVTAERALREPCGFDRNGARVSEEGEYVEAQLVGDIKYAHSDRERAAFERKLSRHMGFCYLGVSTSVGGVTKVESARAGAVKRVALALSKISGEPVAISDGKRTTTYQW